MIGKRAMSRKTMQRINVGLVIAVLLGAGWTMSRYVLHISELDGRHELVTLAVRVADAIQPEQVQMLPFSEADHGNPVYQRISFQMHAFSMKSRNPPALPGRLAKFDISGSPPRNSPS